MKNKKENRIKFKEYARGTGFYVCSSLKGVIFIVNWLLINLIVSLLIISGFGHWFFKVVLYLGVIPAFITFYFIGRFQKRIGRKIRTKALKNIHKTDQILGEALVCVTDPDNSYMYGTLAGNRWIESLVVVLFLFGFIIFGVVIEYLLRLNSGFQILDFYAYSTPLKIFLCWANLLSVQLFLFIWTQKLRLWRLKMIWGNFYEIFKSPSRIDNLSEVHNKETVTIGPNWPSSTDRSVMEKARTN